MKFSKPEFWDLKKPNFLSYFLLPLTLPISLNNFFLKKKKNWKKDRIIKVCVGNIYIGGTGKTPLSIKIYDLLNQENIKSIVIKKFYKNQLDEQKLIKKYSNLICKKNRLNALKEAENHGYKYAVFDDGLQDRSINYDLSIVCFSNLLWIGNGFLIPAGPLREKIEALKKYDAVVLNGNKLLNEKIINQIKEINPKIEIFESNYELKNLSKFNKDINYTIFSGIGNSKNFFELLNKNELKIIKEFKFPDHHNYKDDDLQKIIHFAKVNNTKIITTEKDFIKLEKKYLDKIMVAKIELTISKKKEFVNFLKSKHEIN